MSKQVMVSFMSLMKLYANTPMVTASNQIRAVEFMCATVDTRLFFTKKFTTTSTNSIMAMGR